MKRLPDSFVRRMHRDYAGGLSLSATARKWNRSDRGSLREVFNRRGLKVRPLPYEVKRNPNGSYKAAKPATAAEITAMIAKLTRVEVPNELKREWRLWPLARRMDFINRARERFPSSQPIGAFSKNVEPFDYGTPRAREIVKRLNRGLDSRHKKAQLKPACRGVIWEGRLFYWCHGDALNGDGYFVGTWKRGIGRPCLHHILWEKTNGRKVPSKHTVIHRDGNKNNLDPSNLGLRSMADCARQNSVWSRLKTDPANPGLILLGKQIRAASIAGKRRKSLERTALLYKRFDNGEQNNGNHKLVRHLVAQSATGN